MSSAIDLIGKAIDLVQTLREMQVKDAETRNVIADLMNALADVKIEFANLKQQTQDLHDQLDKVHERNDLRAHMTFKNNVYFLEGEHDRPEGPYCPRCFDQDAALSLLTTLDRNNPARRMGSYYKCPQCDKMF